MANIHQSIALLKSITYNKQGKVVLLFALYLQQVVKRKNTSLISIVFFGQLNCKPSHLSLFDLPSSDLESFILEKDAIYVGGGNTKSCLALWKEWKLDVYLKKAWEAGVVLSGISAGANCWFEECVTDSIPGNLTALKCLGFLKGSCCPHYDGEKNRRPTYHQLLQENKLSNGLAIDDHVALHYIEDQLTRVVRANEKGSAYKVEKSNQKIHEEKLESIFIGDLL